MPRTQINLTYVCVMPCNMCYSCRQRVHLFISMISPGDQGCKSWPWVSLHPAIVTAWETPWRWLMSVQPVERKEKQQNQWYFVITSLISPQFFQGHDCNSQKSQGDSEDEHWAVCSATCVCSPWSSSCLHPQMGGNRSQRGSGSLTQLRKDRRAAPLLVAGETGRGEKKKKLYGDYFACETIRLYFLSGKTEYFFSNCQENSLYQDRGL